MNANSSSKIRDKKVAVLVTDGFEQSEFSEPKKALEAAGAKVTVVSLAEGSIQGMNHDEKADTFDVDITVSSADSREFDALLIPGGVRNPDLLRANDAAVHFVKDFFNSKKPVFAICHGPQVLITAGVVKGRKMTSYNTVKVDLENAGAEWVDEAVVVDQGLVTSRTPDDLPDFNAKILEELAEGRHERSRSSDS